MLDWRLKRELRDPSSTVRDEGWAGTRDGELLPRVAAAFDVIITTDQSLQYQQQLSRLGLAVIVLRASSNKRTDLVPLFPEVQRLIDFVKPARVYVVGNPPGRSR